MSPESEQKLAKVRNENTRLRLATTRDSRTYMAAIRKSRPLFWILLRERHMFTNAQAPTASTNVHRSVGGISDVGTMVEKRDKARGDYETPISLGGTRDRNLTTCVHV